MLVEALHGATWPLLRPTQPRWAHEGRAWPNREASRFVRAGGRRWHVQEMGRGPVLLLLHGTGASTHSWRDLAPALAEHFTVVAPDLPGHGFSEGGGRLSLPGMAAALGELLAVMDRRPSLAVGHSAGAAIACRMRLDGTLQAPALVALNGALLPFGLTVGRAAAWLGSPLARLLSLNPLLPFALARRSRDPAVVARLLRGTGSRIDAEGCRLYGQLMASPGHVGATLAMMAAWDLARLQRELTRLPARLLLVVGDADRYIPPDNAKRVVDLVPDTTQVTLHGLGHLAHEEHPHEVADLIADFATTLETPGD